MRFVRVPAAKVGDDGRMFKTTVKSQGYTFEFYGMIWRYKAVVASVLGGGLKGTVKASDVAALAQAQQARMASVLG